MEVNYFYKKRYRENLTQRNEAIVKDYQEGISIENLCKKYGLQKQRIRHIVHNKKVNNRIGVLFGEIPELPLTVRSLPTFGWNPYEH